MKNVLAILLLCMFLSGCAMMGLEDYNRVICDLQQNCYRNYVVEIISEPPGAKIEINGEYIGIAPLRYVINRSINYVESFNVIAYPVTTGQSIQVKNFVAGEVVPRRICFNMAKQ